MKDVVVAGGTGRTGRAIVQYLTYQPNVRVVAVISRKYAGLHMSSVINDLAYDIPIYKSCQEALGHVRPAVLVDFTEPGIAKEHFQLSVEQNINPILGTTGFTEDEIEHFKRLCVRYCCGAALIPNFSLGAFLMLQAVRFGAAFFQDAAVIDMYPPHKTEVPSGTSKQILFELKNYGTFSAKNLTSRSLRLAGVTAYQEVRFGGIGETVVISHDVSDRSCFGVGVALAIQKINHFNRLVTDLAELLC